GCDDSASVQLKHRVDRSGTYKILTRLASERVVVFLSGYSEAPRDLYLVANVGSGIREYTAHEEEKIRAVIRDNDEYYSRARRESRCSAPTQLGDEVNRLVIKLSGTFE